MNTSGVLGGFNKIVTRFEKKRISIFDLTTSGFSRQQLNSLACVDKELSGQDPDIFKLPCTNKIEGKTTGVW